MPSLFCANTSCPVGFCQSEVVMSRELEQQLIDELSMFGISLGDDQVRLLISYLNLVIEKNKTMNLTRITNPAEAVTLHLVDSLLPLACDTCQINRDSSLLDMGTGAGFPGVPLAVATSCTTTLVDSVRKKVDAVAEFVSELGIPDVVTQHARLEHLAQVMPDSQDYVIARAVAQSNVLIEYATPFLKKSGLLVIEKGRPDETEISEADAAASICGVRLVSRETFELPRSLGHREILIYKKVARSKIPLPRKVGMARNKPLGVRQ